MIKTFNQQICSKVTLWLMVFLIALLPLFKGGNYPGAMPLFIFVMMAVLLLSLQRKGEANTMPWLLVWLGVSGAVLIHAFVVPLYLNNGRFFSNGLNEQTSVLLHYPLLSNIRLLEVWSYFTSMWLFVWRVSGLSRQQVSVLLTVLFAASSFQAIYGVAHLASGNTSVLGLWTKEYFFDDATGTFVNRNHFSGMLAIASPLVLSGLLAQTPLIMPSLSRMYRLIVAAFYLMLLVIALISSHSRMGTVAALFGVFVCVFLLFESAKIRKNQQKINVWFVVGCLFLFLFLFATWFGIGDILDRYVNLDNGTSRLDVWKVMFGMSFNTWFVGVGPGYFEDVFQIIKPNYFSSRFIYAHNDYLEFVFEFGLFFSAIILSLLVYWFKKLRPVDGDHMLKAGVYGSIAAIALHSLVDFNLQIPASCLCFCLGLGLFVNPAMVSQHGKAMNDSKEVRRTSSAVKRSRRSWPKNKREWLAFLRSD